MSPARFLHGVAGMLTGAGIGFLFGIIVAAIASPALMIVFNDFRPAAQFFVLFATIIGAFIGLAKLGDTP